MDPPPPVGLEEAEARIADGGEVRPLHEVTDLAGASVDFEESRLPLGVYAPAECADSVRRAAESLLRDGGR